MLKLDINLLTLIEFTQPPSGGCVLKHFAKKPLEGIRVAAAFGRLCVETMPPNSPLPLVKAAAFGRLCVETSTRKLP